MSDPENRIWIVQCLCPRRHAILAAAFDPEDISVADMTSAFARKIIILLADKSIDPWCGICGSGKWTVEAAMSKFSTIEEARAPLDQLERDNAIARRLIGGNNPGGTTRA